MSCFRLPVYYRESVKAAFTVPAMYPALDTLYSLVNSDIEWGVRDSSGWPSWFANSEVIIIVGWWVYSK